MGGRIRSAPAMSEVYFFIWIYHASSVILGSQFTRRMAVYCTLFSFYTHELNS